MRLLAVLVLLLFSLPAFAGGVEELLQVLEVYRGDRVACLAIVRRLEKLGPDARSALPALRKLAETDRHEEVRDAAQRAVMTLTRSA